MYFFTVFSHLYVRFFLSFSLFFFLHHCQSTILLYILPNNFFLPCIGWPRMMERWWWLSSRKQIFYFVYLFVSRYLNRRLNFFFLPLISRDLFVFYFQRLKILSFEKSQFQVFFFQVLSFGIEAIERFQSNQPTYVSTFCYIIIVIIVGYCVITYKCSRSSRRSHRNRE